jgi:multidrug efflux pump subunit AcrB
MVIFSFILVLGMVVDGAIIVAENIHRHIERGEDPVTASKLGIEEVAWPVIAADMTTVAAYLPMLLVPGIMGDFMSVMPKVVSVALLGSVLVDHFVIPVIASLWYRKRVDVPGGSESSHVGPIILEGNVAHAGASRIRPNVGPFTRAYAVVLRGALANRWFVLAWSAIAIWGAVLLQKRVGFQFFPTSDRGQFEVKYELPLGYSIAETTEAARRITEPLAEMQKESDDLVHFVSAIGASGGLASRLENDPATGPEFGTVMVQLKSPLDRRRHENDFIRELRGRIKPLPGMKVTIHQVEEGPPGGADVAVRFSGKQLSRLGELAETLSERLREIDGTTDVRTDYRPDSPEIVVAPRPDKVGIFDMDKQQVARAVQTAVLGDTTIELSLEDEDVTLRIQADAQYRKDVGAIQRVVLTGPTGRKSMIGELADFRRGVGLYSVNRYNRRRATVTACDVQDPVTPDSVFGKLRKEVLPQLGFKPLPPTPPAGVGAFFADVSRQVKTAMGVEIEEDQAVEFTGQPGTPAEGVRATFTGQNEERDKNFAYLLNSMAIAVVLILAILVLQFNSYRQAFVVLLTVPLSFVGVVIGMWVCDFPFSLASFIGLVSLTGVVVNDAIVMVDFTNQARGRGMTVKQALMEAGVNRLRPVLLTTVTTIGGLLPLFLNLSGGAEFWQPLTGAVVFGLGFATILTLVVIPVAYSVVYNGADR